MVLNKHTWLALVHNIIKLLLKILDKLFFFIGEDFLQTLEFRKKTKKRNLYQLQELWEKDALVGVIQFQLKAQKDLRPNEWRPRLWENTWFPNIEQMIWLPKDEWLKFIY